MCISKARGQRLAVRNPLECTYLNGRSQENLFSSCTSTTNYIQRGRGVNSSPGTAIERARTRFYAFSFFVSYNSRRQHNESKAFPCHVELLLTKQECGLWSSNMAQPGFVLDRCLLVQFDLLFIHCPELCTCRGANLQLGNIPCRAPSTKIVHNTVLTTSEGFLMLHDFNGVPFTNELSSAVNGEVVSPLSIQATDVRRCPAPWIRKSTWAV